MLGVNIEIQIIAKDEQNDDRIFGPGGLGAIGDGLGEAARAACSVQGGVAWLHRRATALGQEDSAEASASLRSCFRLSTLNSTLLHFFN